MPVHSEFVHVGYGGTVAVQRVLAIATPDSSPLKRMIKLANKENRLINLTYGRKAKTVMVLDSGHVVLAALQTTVILKRMQAASGRGGAVDLEVSAETSLGTAPETHADNSLDGVPAKNSSV